MCKENFWLLVIYFWLIIFFCATKFECCWEYNTVNMVLFSTKQIANILYVSDETWKTYFRPISGTSGQEFSRKGDFSQFQAFMLMQLYTKNRKSCESELFIKLEKPHFGPFLLINIRAIWLFRARLHETRSELKLVWDFYFGVKFHFGVRQLHYQRSHDFKQGETHFGANFTSVNLTEKKCQTAMSFSCKQQMPAVK